MTRHAITVAVLLACIGQAVAQYAPGAPKSYLSTASNNCTLVQTGSLVYLSGLFLNTTGAIFYLKIYDASVTPTAALTPVRRIPIPFSGGTGGGGGVVDIPPGGLDINNGFGFCLTGGIADNDNTSATTGLTINFTIK